MRFAAGAMRGGERGAGSLVTLSFAAEDCLLIDDPAMRARHAA